MEPYEIEDLQYYAWLIIDKTEAYNHFNDSEKVKRLSSDLLANYLLASMDKIENYKEEQLREYINRWIQRDLMCLNSQLPKDGSKVNCFKTKRKKNMISSPIASIALVIALLSGSVLGINISKNIGKRETSVIPVEEVVQRGENMQEDIHRILAELPDRSNPEVQRMIDELLADAEAHKIVTTYGNPMSRVASGDFLADLPMLATNYYRYYNSNNSAFSQLPVYNFYDYFRSEYDFDVYRIMDVIYNKHLKAKTKPVRPSEVSREYNELSKYASYPAYVFGMLADAGYDVGRYNKAVTSYTSNMDVNPLAPNYGISNDDVRLLDEMFSMYDEYISSLRQEYDRGGRK